MIWAVGRNGDLIEYLEHRRMARWEAVRSVSMTIAVVVVGLLLLWLATRTFLHFTGIGAAKTLIVTPHGFHTRVTPTSILP